MKSIRRQLRQSKHSRSSCAFTRWARDREHTEVHRAGDPSLRQKNGFAQDDKLTVDLIAAGGEVAFAGADLQIFFER